MKMAPTPQHLLEILRRVRAGKHLVGGDVPLPSLHEEVDRLLVRRLIEPDGTSPYRLTQLGAEVLAVACSAP
jgi:hypothetical protein